MWDGPFVYGYRNHGQLEFPRAASELIVSFDFDDNTFDGSAAETAYGVTRVDGLHAVAHFCRFPSASIHSFDFTMALPQSQENTQPSAVTFQ